MSEPTAAEREKQARMQAGLRALAKTLLGSDAPVGVNLGKIDRALAVVKPAVVPGKTPAFPPPAPRPPEAITVLPEYEFVVQAVACGSPAIFVTGKAGTGKSTLIRYLTDTLANCAVVAPTALAAVNVGGSTIHSFFSIPPRTLNADEAADPRGAMLPVIENLGTLVIDEVSMVTPDLVDCINNTLQRVRRDARPFGGVPVIFVGDLLQLPPVVSDPDVAQYYSDRYRSPFFYSADVFHDVDLVPIELTTVFRQKDREFVALLDKIRLNRDQDAAVAAINQHCCRTSSLRPGRRPATALACLGAAGAVADANDTGKAALYLVPTNAAARAINRRNLDVLASPLRSYEALVTGRFEMQRNAFQAPHTLELKVGAQVLFVRNNKPNWLNGTLGEVVDMGDELLRVRLLNTGNTVTVGREKWEKLEYYYDRAQRRIASQVVGCFQQFPVTLGWAITIHKSQGMTLESVRIDLGNGAFCSGQTYVALSRCRSLDGIVLDRAITPRDVRTDERILAFYAHLGSLRNCQEQDDEDGHGPE